MYEIRLNKAILHDSDVNSESRLSAGKIVEEVNQIPSFWFTIPPVNPLFSSELHDRKDIVSVKNILTNKTEFEGVLMFHEQSMDSSGKLCIKASAEGFLGYLCDSIQLYRHYENTTAVDFLTALLEAHNSQVSAEKRLCLGICDIANADYTGSKTTAYRTTLEEIRVNLIERIGGEIQVRKVDDKLYLDYLERIGMESSTAVELAENMKSLDVKTDSANIITRLIPLGTQINDETAERLTIESINDGKLYIDDENAVEKYGIIVGTAEFDDITLPENLLERAEKYLQNNNRLLKSYEAQILDLSVLYGSHQSIECGNTYTFKNAFFGLDEPLRIMKKTTDIYKPYSPVVQIGDKTESITDIAVNQAKLIEYKLPEQKINILTSAKETATNLIKSGFNGYVVANENEICIMDTNDKNTAQKVWRWNENGFGFSNTGYNGTYGTAMTMDGKIVADFITAGILRGIEISNGDGTFHVSPDGKVTASAMNITGGTINIQAENSINDIISLNHGNNHLHITPSFFRVINPNRNAVQIDGSVIRGYSYFWEGELTETFTLNSATGNFVTNGDISAKEVHYFHNGERVSVRQEIDKIHSEINSLSAKIDANYSDLSEKIQSNWEQILQVRETLDFIIGGGNS
ncbi:MAG: phage tail protein [Ruminococcus sp.]|nr:phage tail protein [Ruminococcus sp.]